MIGSLLQLVMTMFVIVFLIALVLFGVLAVAAMASIMFRGATTTIVNMIREIRRPPPPT